METTDRKRTPSPAKTTIEKLNSAGFITDGKITLIHPNGEDTTDLPLKLLVGMRESLLDAASSKMDRAIKLLAELRAAGLLDDVLKAVNG